LNFHFQYDRIKWMRKEGEDKRGVEGEEEKMKEGK